MIFSHYICSRNENSWSKNFIRYTNMLTEANKAPSPPPNTPFLTLFPAHPSGPSAGLLPLASSVNIQATRGRKQWAPCRLSERLSASNELCLSEMCLWSPQHHGGSQRLPSPWEQTARAGVQTPKAATQTLCRDHFHPSHSQEVGIWPILWARNRLRELRSGLPMRSEPQPGRIGPGATAPSTWTCLHLVHPWAWLVSVGPMAGKDTTQPCWAAAPRMPIETGWPRDGPATPVHTSRPWQWPLTSSKPASPCQPPRIPARLAKPYVLWCHHLQRPQSLHVLPPAPTACRKHLSDAWGTADGRPDPLLVPHSPPRHNNGKWLPLPETQLLISERGTWVPRSSPHASKAWSQQQ